MVLIMNFNFELIGTKLNLIKFLDFRKVYIPSLTMNPFLDVVDYGGSGGLAAIYSTLVQT